MNFDIEIFQKLNEFRKNEQKSLNLLKQEAEEIFQFLGTKTLNELMQFKTLNQFKMTLESIIRINYHRKNWWQKLIGFFGFVSQDEKSVRHLLNSTKKNLNTLAIPSRPSSLFEEPKLCEQLGYVSYNDNEKIKYLAHHLMGTEEFAEESEFHGKSPSDAYKHFYQDFKDFIQKYNTDDEDMLCEFNNLLTNLEEAYILAYQLDVFHALRKRLNENQKLRFQAEFVFNIKMKIMNLPLGKSFILPYTYQEQKDGHALVIEWIKEQNGQVSARIINTGDGSEHTESTITKLRSIFNDSERPIKKTKPYDLEILNSNLIDRMLEPIFTSEKPSAKMNDFFESIPLDDASEHLTLQTNGTCAHDSILAWFQTKISTALYSLFNVYTLEKAQKRLSALNPNGHNATLNPLAAAAQKTIKIAQEQLHHQHNNKNQQLQKMNRDLGVMRKKNHPLDNYSDYINKKISKIDEQEKQQLKSAKSLDDVTKSGFFSALFTSNKGNKPSPVLSKAILAKKINAHQQFVQQADNILTRPR